MASVTMLLCRRAVNHDRVNKLNSSNLESCMIYILSVDKLAGRPCPAQLAVVVAAIRCRSYSTALIERELFAVSANFLISNVL